MSNNLKSEYDKQGFLSPVEVISRAQARRHRQILQIAERRLGAMHYQAKVHTILRSPYQLATHPTILNVVEQMIGADILLYNTTYIIKEANSATYVSWHQDLTYWGLSDNRGDHQVSVWLALSTADEHSGCMRMIPGSHCHGALRHGISQKDENNVLYQSQTVHGVDEQQAVHCPLQSGQASFHHGWMLHCSSPNNSDDRRIGLNIQYIAPHVRQVKLPGYSALLVRGKDRFQHYQTETPPSCNMDPQAVTWREQQEQLHRRIASID